MGRIGDKTVLCIVIAFICNVNITYGDIIASYATGKYIHEIVWVAKIQIGTIQKNIEAVIDRTGYKLTTIFPIDKIVSKSYSTYAGGSDIVPIGGQDILFEHEVDSYLPTALGCSSCKAVLGVGAGSPIWLHFNKILYTPGSILLDETCDSFDQLANGYGYVTCKVGYPEICVTSGIMYGTSVSVVFGSNEPSLLLPPPLFAKYVDGKSLKKNPPEEWNDIRIHFPAIPGTGADNQLVIQSEHLISPSSDGGNHLLVDISPIPDTIIIGKSARLNVMIQVDQTDGKAKIASIKVSKHYSTAGLLAGILVALIFEYWRQTPTGTWEDFNFSSPYKITSVGVTIFASIVFYSNEEYQNVLEPFPVVNVYVGIMIFGMIVWNIGVILMYFTSSSRNILGWVVEEKKVLLGSMSNIKKGKGHVNVGESSNDRNKYTHAQAHRPGSSDAAGMETTTNISDRMSRKRRNENGRGGWSESSGIIKSLFQSEVKDVQLIAQSPESTYEKIYLNTRLWIVASVAMETILLALTFLIVEETRTEALWGLAGMLFILYILYRLLYNLFIIATLPRGNKSFVWTGFVVYLCLVIVSTVLVAQRYIVGPTVERLFTTEEFLTIFGSVTLYLIIVYWAAWAAISAILIQDKKMAFYLASKRKLSE